MITPESIEHLNKVISDLIVIAECPGSSIPAYQMENLRAAIGRLSEHRAELLLAMDINHKFNQAAFKEAMRGEV